ncbi:MAG TPA: hypothetical protein VLN59_01765 [Burkholderiales bacterium]|nr:hypothetical protein [Burkholderiales bacterium]
MSRVLTSGRHAVPAVLLLAAMQAAAQSVAIGPELWDRPRTGTAIMEQPAVRQAVRAYLAQPGAQLVIHHAPGQDAAMYAEELNSWLIALAVNPEHIRMRGDLARGDPLKIEVVQ